MLLYPGVDSLNHNPLTQNSWKSDEESFGIVVNDELTAGMEVWNPYGGKSNGECEFFSFLLVCFFFVSFELMEGAEMRYGLEFVSVVGCESLRRREFICQRIGC